MELKNNPIYPLELSSLGRQRPHIKTRTIPAWQMQLFIRLFLRAYPRLSVFQLPYQISPATHNAVLSGGKGKLVFTTISCDYLLVGPGAGGGAAGTGFIGAAGAGAGDVLSGTDTLTAGNSYPVVVPIGGLGGALGSNNSGANALASSTFNGHTAVSGGYGDGAGGSGGGNAINAGGANANNSPGTGTRNGGHGSGSGPDFGGGGGAGAGAIGGDGGGTYGGVGGVGVSSSISGVAVTYSKGGNGGYLSGNADGADGVNPGDGGGGASASSAGGANHKGGNGAPGTCIIRYLTASVNSDGSGGTITHSGGYTIHTLTSNGTFIAPT